MIISATTRLSYSAKKNINMLEIYYTWDSELENINRHIKTYRLNSLDYLSKKLE